VTNNWGKPLLFALAVSVLAVGCNSSGAANTSSAPATVTPSVATDQGPEISFVARIVAAAKSAESEPHGGIGEPATATLP
jgi:hypothetical protein